MFVFFVIGKTVSYPSLEEVVTGRRVYLSLLSVQCPGNNSLPRTISPIATVPQECKPQPWTPEPEDQGASIEWQPQKNPQGSRYKNQHARCVQNSTPRDTLLWNMTEDKYKVSACSPWSLERITVSLWIHV